MLKVSSEILLIHETMTIPFPAYSSSFSFKPLYRLIISANLQEANEESKSVTKASAMKGAASLVGSLHFLAE